MASKKETSKTQSRAKPDKNMAIVGLILNILILPGLGTIVAGDTKTGVIQLVLFLVSIPLMFVLIGIPMAFAIWIWSIVTGIKMVQAAN
jgi:TM2 domain-containing membrane protein YozV